MTIESALKYAQSQALIHESAAKNAENVSDKVFHEAHADALNTLCNEIKRLQHEYLVAVSQIGELG